MSVLAEVLASVLVCPLVACVLVLCVLIQLGMRVCSALRLQLCERPFIQLTFCVIARVTAT